MQSSDASGRRRSTARGQGQFLWLTLCAVFALIITSLGPSLSAVSPPKVVAAAPPAAVNQIERINGSVHYRVNGDSPVVDVKGTSDFPPVAQAFTDCESLGILHIGGFADVAVGANTTVYASNLTPGTNEAQVIVLQQGALQFNMHTPASSRAVFLIETSDASVRFRNGSGFIAAGPKGTQIVALGGVPSDYKVTAGGLQMPFNSGQGLTFLAATATAPADPTYVTIDGVDNPAFYQFAGGNNPLASGPQAPKLDPSASGSGGRCRRGFLAWWPFAGAALAGLLGSGHGIGNPFVSPGITPANPSPTPTPSSGASTSPSTGPSSSPSTGPSSSPSTGPSSSPSTSPSTGPSAPPPTPSPTPTPTPTPTPSCDPGHSHNPSQPDHDPCHDHVPHGPQ